MGVHFLTCPFCEAMCGLKLYTKDDTVLQVLGDPDDPLSRGFLCAKALALKEVHHDPERLRSPLKRTKEGWVKVSWEDGLREAVDRIHEIQQRHGRDSVAFYSGNPNIHSYTAQLGELEFKKSLGTKALFSTASMDHLPHLFTSYHCFGHQLLLPVPDLDRTMFLLVIGANPAESNGSLMAAPGIPRRFRELQARGGRIVVVDPRHTKTAKLADAHHYINPGTDALLLAAMIHNLFADGLVRLGRLESFTRGIRELEQAMLPYSPETVAGVTGISPDAIRKLARDFATSPAAVCYTRVGACTQEFGALSCWLGLALNVVTSNLDRIGGAMFPRPAVDIVRIAALLGNRGSYGSWRSRLRGLPEFGGELPVAVLAEEIDTPGDGRIHALVTSAGNPVLSTPNGRRLDSALDSLDYMVSIDFYLNETTRHANLILPPVFALERDHYDVVFRAFGVRNTSRYTAPVFPRDSDSKTDWQIYMALAGGLAEKRGGFRGRIAGVYVRMLKGIGPQRVLGGLLRVGPHRISLARLRREARTIDLGPLTPCLPARLYTRDKNIQISPAVLLADLARLADRLLRKPSENGALALIGRRQTRNNNSWLHHAPSLMRGPDRCTLLMHPVDAAKRGLGNAQLVEIRSSRAVIQAPLELCDKIMPGIVSLPHGFGHGRQGTAQTTANAHPGVSLNDLTDDANVDALTGTASFSATSVWVGASHTATDPGG